MMVAEEIRPVKQAEGLIEAKPLRGRDTVVLTVRIERALLDKLDELAAAQGVSRSEYVEWKLTSQTLRKR